jgi:O-antigen/teichoic acid export membrane protein
MLLKSTLIYAPSILLPRVAALLVVLCLTRLLPVAEYGLYALTVVVGEILDMTCTSWIRLAQLRLDTSRRNSLRSATAKSLTLTAAALCLGVIASFAIARALVPAEYKVFGLSVGFYLVANGFLRLGLTVLRMRGRAATYSALEGARAVCIAACAIAAVLFVSRSFVAASVATSLVTAFFATLAYFLCLRGVDQDLVVATGYRERIRYGVPIVFLMVVTYLVTSSDRLLLQILASSASLGIYAAAYALARQPIEALANAVNQGSFPELIARFETGGRDAAARFIGETLVFLLAILLPVLLLVCALSQPIVHLLLPAAYRGMAPMILPYVALGAIFFHVKVFVFDQVFYVVRKNWIQVATFLPAGVVAIVANAVLIPQSGALGAAIAMCLANMVGVLTSAIVSARYIQPVVSFKHLSVRFSRLLGS